MYILHKWSCNPWGPWLPVIQACPPRILHVHCDIFLLLYPYITRPLSLLFWCWHLLQRWQWGDINGICVCSRNNWWMLALVHTDLLLSPQTPNIHQCIQYLLVCSEDLFSWAKTLMANIVLHAAQSGSERGFSGFWIARTNAILRMVKCSRKG